MQHVSQTQIFESTRLVQRLCAAEAVSSDCVPRCRRRCLSSQLPEAVRPLHLSQMWAQVLQPLLLPIRGGRCSVYTAAYVHHTYMAVMNERLKCNIMCCTFLCTCAQVYVRLQ